MQALTEGAAARAFAIAWNRLEPDGFIELLAPDARYASQWVFDELEGADAIAGYLRGKMKTVRERTAVDSQWAVRVDVGRTTGPIGARSCAHMQQGDGTKVAVLFEVSGSKIQRCDVCMPQPLGIVCAGVYPGLGEADR